MSRQFRSDAVAQLVARNDSEVRTPAERIRDGLLSSADVKALVPPEAIVEGLLFRNSLAMLFGASGIGKSFVAIDVALHVASGAWWQGKEVRQGSVLYVVAEGASGFGQRLHAWERRHQISTDELPVRWLPWAVNIADLGWSAALAHVVAEERPMLVVIDTFARCALGAEENSARDMGRVIAHLDQIRRAGEACLWLIHHSGKNAEAGARGSSALKAAMDTELEVVGDSRNFLLHVRKQKDAPEGNPLSLRLRSVLGTSSVTVDRAQRIDEDDLSANSAAALAALLTVDVPEGASTKTWRICSGIAERSFYRCLAELVEADEVRNIGSKHQPRYRPTSALRQEKPDGDTGA